MAVPFAEDQARGRHQVEHRRDRAAIELRRRDLAEFRKAFFVLRPQAVDHERVRPLAAFGLPLRPVAGSVAERGRPRQRKNVEIELPGLVLARLLGRNRDGRT